jgi:hypothetical protein
MFPRRVGQAIDVFHKTAADAGAALEGGKSDVTDVHKAIRSFVGSLDSGAGRDLPHDLTEAYDTILSTVSTHATSPQLSESPAVLGAKALDYRLSEQIDTAARNRLGYLYQTLPRPSEPADLQAGWTPPPSELATWGRRVAAAERPELLIHDLAAGTLVPETYETVKTLYPAFYERVRNAVAEKLQTDPGSVPYAQRQLASIMLGVPTVDTRPGAIQAAQARLKAVAQQSMEVAKPSGAPTKTPRGTAFAPSRFNMKSMGPTPAQSAMSED